MSAHTELEGRPVTLNEEGNDHVESLQAEARQADEAASGQVRLNDSNATLGGGKGLASALGYPTATQLTMQYQEERRRELEEQRAIVRKEQAMYRRQRALELAVDVYKTGLAIGHADITKVARDFYLFLDGKMIYGEPEA